MRRVVPAIVLFVLSPLVAEYLLGDFTLAALAPLLFLAPMYGGGAVLIREVVRRTGRGWSSILLLALAYAVFEEGIVTQSLFNPDYAGSHLLDRGFVPALGIAVPWTLYVLALHTAWSMSVPIALVEEGTDRRTAPWLRTRGLIVVSVLFVLGAVAVTAGSYADGHFRASGPQLAAVVVVIAALIVAAFTVPRRISRRPGNAPAPWVVLLVTLAGGSLVIGCLRWNPVLSVVTMVAVFAAVGAAILIWSRRDGWGGTHRLAAAGGGLLTYAWHGFTTTPLGGDGPIVTPVSHVVLALAAVAVLVAEIGIRARNRQTERHGR
jgi:hypothetical protein